MTASSDALVDRVRRLRASVAEHKRALNFHRRALQGDKAELVDLEARCEALGIRLVVTTHAGEGDVHGHRDRPRS